MSRKRGGRAVSAFEAPEDPSVHEHLRSSLPGKAIPGIVNDVLGYGRYGEPAKEDTVVLGHPEVAGQFTTRYDHNDKYLGDMHDASTERADLNYVGSEEIRKRSKGSPFG